MLYRGIVSEIFEPYMDPSNEWYFQTFTDTGEFGLGVSAYLDGHYADADGEPIEAEDVVCVFRALCRRHRVAPHRGHAAGHGGEAGRDLGGEDGGHRRELRLHPEFKTSCSIKIVVRFLSRSFL